MAELFEWAAWAMFAIVKFVITPSAMIAVDYSFMDAFLTTGIGATFGLLAFYYAGPTIYNTVARLFRFKGSKRRIFTKRNRRIVSFKNKYGLPGLALVCGFISVPLAGILAGKYFKDSAKVLPALTFAFWFWAFLFTFVSWKIKHLS